MTSNFNYNRHFDVTNERDNAQVPTVSNRRVTRYTSGRRLASYNIAGRNFQVNPTKLRRCSNTKPPPIPPIRKNTARLTASRRDSALRDIVSGTSEPLPRQTMDRKPPPTRRSSASNSRSPSPAQTPSRDFDHFVERLGRRSETPDSKPRAPAHPTRPRSSPRNFPTAQSRNVDQRGPRATKQTASTTTRAQSTYAQHTTAARNAPLPKKPRLRSEPKPSQTAADSSRRSTTPRLRSEPTPLRMRAPEVVESSSEASPHRRRGQRKRRFGPLVDAPLGEAPKAGECTGDPRLSSGAEATDSISAIRSQRAVIEEQDTLQGKHDTDSSTEHAEVVLDSEVLNKSDPTAYKSLHVALDLSSDDDDPPASSRDIKSPATALRASDAGKKAPSHGKVRESSVKAREVKPASAVAQVQSKASDRPRRKTESPVPATKKRSTSSPPEPRERPPKQRRTHASPVLRSAGRASTLRSTPSKSPAPSKSPVPSKSSGKARSRFSDSRSSPRKRKSPDGVEGKEKPSKREQPENPCTSQKGKLAPATSERLPRASDRRRGRTSESPPSAGKHTRKSGTATTEKKEKEGEVTPRRVPSRTRTCRTMEEYKDLLVHEPRVGGDDSPSPSDEQPPLEKKQHVAGASKGKPEASSSAIAPRSDGTPSPEGGMNVATPPDKRASRSVGELRRRESSSGSANDTPSWERKDSSLEADTASSSDSPGSARASKTSDPRESKVETDIRFKRANKEERKELRKLIKGSGDAVVSTIEEARISLKSEDFRCLRPSGWLSDEVINSFLALVNDRNKKYFQSRSKKGGKQNPGDKEGITSGSGDAAKQDAQVSKSEGDFEQANSDKVERPRTHIFNSFFLTRLTEPRYDYNTVRRWLTRAGYRILDLDQIIIPVNIQNIHWVLVAIDLKKKSFTYFDSFREPDRKEYLRMIRRWLVDEVRDKYGEEKLNELNVDSWDMTINPPDVPEQRDGGSCGIFAIYIAEFLERGLRPTFTQENVAALRQRTALFLKHGLPE